MASRPRLALQNAQKIPQTAKIVPLALAVLGKGAVLLLMFALLGGCRPGPEVTPEVAPEVVPEAEAPIAPLAPATSSPESSAPAPNAGAANARPVEGAEAATASPLPDAFLRQWEPLSEVLFPFGAMTLAADEVQWASGQRSPYQVVGAGETVLLQLTEPPRFYDTTYGYIRFTPRVDEGDVADVSALPADSFDSLEAAFYSEQPQSQGADAGMVGGYFEE